MRQDEYDRFSDVAMRLGEQTRANISPETIDAYWLVLQPLEMQDVEKAALTLATAEWFPKVGLWRQAAKEQAAQRAVQDVPERPRDEPWKFECQDCQDEGWVCVSCRTLDCDKDAPEHERRMRACVCRATNRTYQRRNQGKGAA